MYAAYFHLRARPFAATPDSSCFYASDSIQESLDELVLRAQSGQGIAIVTGSAGTGKTLLCRRLVTELGGTWTGIFLPNANVPTRRAFFQAVLFELGQPYQGLDEQELRLAFVAWLRSNAKQARRAILILDDAHLLPERLLEEVRGLADLSEAGKPLLQAVLCGDVALDEQLTSPGLNALNQRVGCHVVLEPLDHPQTFDYIAHRVAWAGGDAAQMFAPEALPLIARLANGIPRCINHLCDHCLLLTYVNEVEQVSRSIVLDAIADLRQLPLPWNEPFQSSEAARPTAESKPSTLTAPAIAADQPESDLFALDSEAAFNPVASIEIGGEPAVVLPNFVNQFKTTAAELGGLADDHCDCEDDEEIIADESIVCDEDVPHQPAVGYGVVPLIDRAPVQGFETNGMTDGIAFTIARSGKATVEHDSTGIRADAPAPTPSISTRPTPSRPVRMSGHHELAAGVESKPVFVEERVVDHYAALDAGRTIPRETAIRNDPPADLGFSDPLDHWNEPAAWSPGIVPLVPDSSHAPDETCPDEAPANLTESAQRLDSLESTEPPAHSSSPEADSGEQLDPYSIVPSDDASADYEDIEDRIGNDVLDLCLETQQAILDRFNERNGDVRQSPGNGSNGSGYETACGDESGAEAYDVVQPEIEPVEGISDLESRRAGDDSSPRSSRRSGFGRTSDAGLKRLFSTLRKRKK